MLALTLQSYQDPASETSTEKNCLFSAVQGIELVSKVPILALLSTRQGVLSRLGLASICS